MERICYSCNMQSPWAWLECFAPGQCASWGPVIGSPALLIGVNWVKDPSLWLGGHVRLVVVWCALLMA